MAVPQKLKQMTQKFLFPKELKSRASKSLDYERHGGTVHNGEYNGGGSHIDKQNVVFFTADYYPVIKKEQRKARGDGSGG